MHPPYPRSAFIPAINGGVFCGIFIKILRDLRVLRGAKLFMNLPRLFHTVKYLKPVQIYGRLWFKLYKPKPDMSSAPATRSIKADLVNPCKKSPSLLSPYRFRFLNQEYELNSVKDWNNPRWGKLWLYNLHYFDYLNENNPPIPPLTKGGFSDEENGEKKNGIYQQIIERWIEENPPGIGNGWEPYPASLRIVNWIKWILDGNSLPDEALHSLAVQTRYLFKKLEYHLLGNHLFANAKALIFAGLFFDGVEAEKWLNKGLQILAKEVPEQVLADGGHFERSSMYHAIILEDLLDLINISQVYNGVVLAEIQAKWRDKTSKMLFALSKQSHPDGEIAFFNDAATGIAAKPDEIQDYARRLGIKSDERNDNRVGCLSETGYYSVSRNDWHLIVDAASICPDYLPGHAHADTLSFELSKGRRRVLVNSGTSCYGISQERLRQRKTPAHNTLSVDGQDSSEVWSGFRVARRAKIVTRDIEILHDKDVILAAHDGFNRLKSVGVHQRTWSLSDDGLVISDNVGGTGTHLVRIFFHLHPSIHVKQGGKRRVDIYDDKGNKIVEMKMDERVRISLKDSTYHPEFGLSILNQVIIGEIETQLPLNISTRLVFV